MRRKLLVTAAYFTFLTPVIMATNPDLTYKINEEEEPQTFVGNIAADSGILSNLSPTERQNIIFELVPNNQQAFTSNLFSLTRTGILQTAVQIDRDGLCSKKIICTLNLKVSAKSTRFFEIVKVFVEILDINDNAPIFPSNRVNISMAEPLPISVELPGAIDKDVGVNGDIKYEITKGNHNFTFSIAYPNGMLTISTTGVDREKKSNYTLQVMATDRGRPPKSGNLTIFVKVIDVNDNPPKFDNLPNEITVSEDLALKTNIFNVTATDPDTGEGGDVEYIIPNTSRDDSALFRIDRKSGFIATAGELDYETKKLHLLTVIAKDKSTRPMSSTAILSIRVTDVNDNSPVISLNTGRRDNLVEISEKHRTGTFLVHVSVQDRDSGRNGVVDCKINNTLFLLKHVVDNDFQIILNVNLDREVIDAYSINMSCGDRGLPQRSGWRVISVRVLDENDNPPIFDNETYGITVSENNSPDKTLLKIHANDNDTGSAGKVQYRLSTFGSGLFTIGKYSGEIKSKRSLDYEKSEEREITFHAFATDSSFPYHSTNSSIIVYVQDLNDVAPAFTEGHYTFNVTEGQKLGSYVGQVFSTDRDEGMNGEVRYSLEMSAHAGNFSINSKNGVITTKEVFDREKQSFYKLTVRAKDLGIPSKWSFVTVNIRINDVNDNPPVLSSPINTTIQVLDSFPIHGVLLKIRAYDIDDGPNGRVTCTISNSSLGKLFYFVNSTNEIRLGMSLRSELMVGEHTMDVIATDHGSPPLQSKMQITVIVKQDFRNTGRSPKTNTQTNLIIIVVMVSVSTLISIALIGAIYIIRSRQRAGKNGKQLVTVPNDQTSGKYSEQSYGSGASTTSTDCDGVREFSCTENTPAMTTLYPYCDSPRALISGNVKPSVLLPAQLSFHLNSPRTSSPVSCTPSREGATNHDTSSNISSCDINVLGDDDLRRSMRNITQQRHINRKPCSNNPYSQYAYTTYNGEVT